MALSKERKTAYLVLQNGEIFKGRAMGAEGTIAGEVVFNTSTASYQELLTDPTYYGQIVVQTYPLVGNRGVDLDADSQIMANGYIVREWCDEPTDIRNRVTLDEYLRERGIVGLCGIDTRRLTRILRDGGYIKGAITESIDDLDTLMEQISRFSIHGAIEAVTMKAPEEYKAEEECSRLAVVNYGTPRAMFQWLLSRGVSLKLFPAFTPASDILKEGFDGILLSDGPGDPDEHKGIIENVAEFCRSGKPVFGVGFGHQVLAIANGIRYSKMAHPHRGSNQPVRILSTGKLMITDQNHAYDVVPEEKDRETAEVIMENVTDKTVEGLRYKKFPGFSVQFMPADGHPLQDTAWIFDEIAAMLKGVK